VCVGVVTEALFCFSQIQYIHVIARSPETSGWQSHIKNPGTNYVYANKRKFAKVL